MKLSLFREKPRSMGLGNRHFFFLLLQNAFGLKSTRQRLSGRLPRSFWIVCPGLNSTSCEPLMRVKRKRWLKRRSDGSSGGSVKPKEWVVLRGEDIDFEFVPASSIDDDVDDEEYEDEGGEGGDDGGVTGWNGKKTMKEERLHQRVCGFSNTGWFRQQQDNEP